MEDELSLDEQIKKAQQDLLTSKGTIAEAQKFVESNKEAETAIAQAEKELAEKLKAVREEKNRLHEAYIERTKILKKARQEEEFKNILLQKLLEEKRLQERFTEKFDELDKQTIGAPWREWAYPHQITGGKHLATTKRCILGDKRGLGKTLTAIIALDMLKAKKSIIFTPKDVSLNFESEVKRWAPDRPVMVLTGMAKLARDALLEAIKHMPECTLILNYEAWRKDSSLVHRLIDCKFDTVIIDESQKIKNHKGVDFGGIRDIVMAENRCPNCGSEKLDGDLKRGRFCGTCLYESKKYGDFRSVESVIPMTGTPIINRPQDLWSSLHLIDPKNFPTINNFLYSYCEQDDEGHWRFQWGGEDRLLKRLGMRYLGRTPETAGVKIPPQTPQHHFIEFDPVMYPRQWKMMQDIQQQGAIMLSEDVAMGIPGILAEIVRKSQALVYPGGIKMYAEGSDGRPDYKQILYTSDVEESIKLDAAIDIIKEAIDEGDRVVLFSRFKEALKAMSKRLNDLGITNIRYDGDLSDNKAREAQLDFDIKTSANHSPDKPCNKKCPNWDQDLADLEMDQMCEGYKYQVFLGQYQKAGQGLNLNAARQEVILDRYYSNAYEDQAAGRIQRLNTTHETIVHLITITAPNSSVGKITIDQWMDGLIESKKKMSDGYDNAHMTSDFIKAMRDGDLL